MGTPPTACIIYDSVFGTHTAFTKSSAVYNVHRLFCLNTQSCSLGALIAAVICMHEQLLASSPGSQSMEGERWGGKICGPPLSLHISISIYLYPAYFAAPLCSFCALQARGQGYNAVKYMYGNASSVHEVPAITTEASAL